LPLPGSHDPDGRMPNAALPIPTGPRTPSGSAALAWEARGSCETIARRLISPPAGRLLAPAALQISRRAPVLR